MTEQLRDLPEEELERIREAIAREEQIKEMNRRQELLRRIAEEEKKKMHSREEKQKNG